MLVPHRRRRHTARNRIVPYVAQAGRVLFGAARRYAASGNRRSVKRRLSFATGGTKRRGVVVPYKRIYKKRYTKCKIKKLCKFMKQRTAVHIHRRREVARITASQNAINIGNNFNGGSLSHHELAMGNLRFYDANTNTLVTKDASSGTYARDVQMSIYRKIVVKNNYQIPVYVEIYSCTPKDATSLTPTTLYNGGLVDQGNPSNTSPLVSFKDSLELKNVYTVKKVVAKTIEPGKTIYASSYSKDFDYAVSTNDAHTLQYQKHQGAHAFAIRVGGKVIGHDSALTEIGMMEAAIDYVVDAEYRIKYDAGKDLHDISISDNSDTFTNGGLVSQKPVADNQAASLT